MKKFNDDFKNLTPCERYAAPELPKADEKNTVLLKKLPSRWQKNAKVVAAIGLASAIIFSGCAGFSDIGTQNNEQRYNEAFRVSNSRSDIEVRLHFGGSGTAFYVAHITEQEATQMILALLETAGLDLSTRLPDFRALAGFTPAFELDLFDESKNVGIVFVDNLCRHSSFRGRTDVIKEEFARVDEDMTVGIFSHMNTHSLGNARESFGEDRSEWPDTFTLSNREKREVRLAIDERITREVQEFVEELRTIGVLN